MKIVVVGTGYVGLVSGTCLAEVGHSVTCIDVNAKKIEELKRGKSPIFEPGLESLITRNIGHERLFFSTDLATALPGSDAVFIAVGTPEGEDGSADLRHVMAVAGQIGDAMTGPLVVIVKSTVPVGTCDDVEAIIRAKLEQRGAMHSVVVASNPEFLKEGAAIEDFMKPERIIVGLDGESGRNTFDDMYRPFILDDPGRLTFMSRRASELTKYGSNAMLATRISFMNELSRLCEIVGANIDDVRRGMGADSRIGRKFLYSGPGYGGSCFPKDVGALVKTAKLHGMNLGILEAVQNANHTQKQHVANKILRFFKGNLRDRRIAVWGLAFKPGTDDVRESPAESIIKELVAAGGTVVTHDPQAMDTFQRLFGDHPQVAYAQNAYHALEGAHCLVLITEWSEYKRPNWEKAARLMASPTVFDFRNQYDFGSLAKRGFYYECVGRVDSSHARNETV